MIRTRTTIHSGYGSVQLNLYFENIAFSGVRISLGGSSWIDSARPAEKSTSYIVGFCEKVTLAYGFFFPLGLGSIGGCHIWPSLNYEQSRTRINCSLNLFCISKRITNTNIPDRPLSLTGRNQNRPVGRDTIINIVRFQINPSPYYNLCLKNTNRNETCTSAMAYSEMCSIENLPVRTPSNCVRLVV